MTYSITSGLALILNLIINREMLKNTKSRFGERKEEQRAAERYCFFIMFSNIFFVVDFAWGILYEHHGNQSLFPLIYLVCVLYFVCMFLSMLAWIRYIVAYLNKKRFRSNLILGAAWLMFAFAIFNLPMYGNHCFFHSVNRGSIFPRMEDMLHFSYKSRFML